MNSTPLYAAVLKMEPISIFFCLAKTRQKDIGFSAFLKTNCWKGHKQTQCEFRLRNSTGKTSLCKIIFCGSLIAKSRRGFFEYLHCSFEDWANMQHQIQSDCLNQQCYLAGCSKGHCRKWFFCITCLLLLKVSQYIFSRDTASIRKKGMVTK